MDTRRLARGRIWTMAAVLLLAVVVFLAMQTACVSSGEKAAVKQMAAREAYALYQQKCLGCHDSVADPEKPGRTRDDWHLVVNVMHDYGLALTPDESDAIVQLLYELRKGMEREAG